MNFIEESDKRVAIAPMLGFSAGDSNFWGSMKAHCPFGYLHADGGADKNFRIYFAANTAYCFEEALYLTPSILYSRLHDVSRLAAAKILCDKHGIKPPTISALMKEIDAQESGEDLGTSRPIVLDAARYRAGYKQSDMTPDSVIEALMSLPDRMTRTQCQRAVEFLGDMLTVKRLLV